MRDERAILVLEDGRHFVGRAIGAPGETVGEIVFNTSMTGYQEILSDPSYREQLVVFTAPQIGNYGVHPDDDQGGGEAARGLVVRELSPAPSSWRSAGSLQDWLVERGLGGLQGVDTRALTLHLRERGAMRAGIFPAPWDLDAAVARLQEVPGIEGRDLASAASTAGAYTVAPGGAVRKRVALLDLGVKRGIVQALVARGLEVEVLPAATDAGAILARKPDGVVLSNGPGDPAAVEGAIATARALIDRLPLLGICLGHQILGLALGARSFKLRFGHHGGNHPVKDLHSGEVWITAQNHNYAIDMGSLKGDDVELTHLSLYDDTLEGFRAPRRRVTAVQFHPEACPGPSDAAAVFDRFVHDLERPWL